MEEVQLKTRDWERLLSAEEQEKYKTPIKQGYFSDYHGTEWKHATFYGAYIWKHPKYLNVVRIFERLVGHRPLWEDVTDDNLRDLFEELEKVYSPNSVKTLTATIKALLNENDETKNIKSMKFKKILRTKSVPAQAVYLNDEEIQRIIDYVPHGKTETYVQRMFIMECLCGARMSDCMRMTTENIDDTGRFLVYIANKTTTEVRVPIHKKLRKFLTTNIPEHIGAFMYETTFNRSLREICRCCGINDKVKVYVRGKERTGQKWEFVSSHTGRRSFATNLAKKGVSIEQIALMMGHMSGNTPNIGMTQRYIVGKMQINSDVLRLFGVYDTPNTDPVTQQGEDNVGKFDAD